MFDPVEVPCMQEVPVEWYLPLHLPEPLASPKLKKEGAPSIAATDSPATPASSTDCPEATENLDLGPRDGGV